MRLSKKRAIELHREAWSPATETGQPFKENFPIWKHNGGKYSMWEVSCSCFLCEYDGSANCKKCPVTWYENSSCRPLLSKWYAANTKAERKKYARLIRDAPERK